MIGDQHGVKGTVSARMEVFFQKHLTMYLKTWGESLNLDRKMICMHWLVRYIAIF